MNAVRKQKEDKPAEPSAGVEMPAVTETAVPVRAGKGSPVHDLQLRLEAAFGGKGEQTATRVTTMLLIIALSTWLAALVLQAGI